MKESDSVNKGFSDSNFIRFKNNIQLNTKLAIIGNDRSFFRDHYGFTPLSQIYLGRSHVCKSLFLAILGSRKKSLRNTDLNCLSNMHKSKLEFLFHFSTSNYPLSSKQCFLALLILLHFSSTGSSTSIILNLLTGKAHATL